MGTSDIEEDPGDNNREMLLTLEVDVCTREREAKVN